MCKETPKKDKGHKCCGGCKTKFNKDAAPKDGQDAGTPPATPNRTCNARPPKNG